MCILKISEEGESLKEMKEPLITTGFIEWCSRHLAEPASFNEELQPNANLNNEPELLLEFQVMKF